MASKADATEIGVGNKVIFWKRFGGYVLVVVDRDPPLAGAIRRMAGEALFAFQGGFFMSRRRRLDRSVVTRQTEFLRRHLSRAAAPRLLLRNPEVLAEVARFALDDQHP